MDLFIECAACVTQRILHDFFAGTGYGYTHVTIGKLPEYKSSPYDAARAKEVKEAKAARGKVVGAPFKSNNPDSMRLFVSRGLLLRHYALHVTENVVLACDSLGKLLTD